MQRVNQSRREMLAIDHKLVECLSQCGECEIQPNYTSGTHIGPALKAIKDPRHDHTVLRADKEVSAMKTRRTCEVIIPDVVSGHLFL